DGPPSATESPTADGGGEALAMTGEIPVGGGMVFGDEQVVVTQPEKGTFKAFTAVCTHQGCIVSSVEDGTISCGCHGSQFDAATGEVVSPPASQPLAEVSIAVEGDQIRLA
ncbi:MAG: Rieske (2Fe-2S) protein, partial [Actinomycetota bacterium]|nr:Rieske (2Fe-2S) protein [Actinomycetota bacterium]